MSDATRRPPLRPDLREESPLAAAERRAKEILAHNNGHMDEGIDKFYIDPDRIPEGWTYEWKTKTVYNQENPSYQVALARSGWEPVAATKHPDMMPHDSKSQTIERDGQILMMRPKSITDMVKKTDRQRARDQVRFKEEQIGQAPAGQFERN